MGIEVISFDIDGTLVDPEYNDLIWHQVIPQLVSDKKRIKFTEALNIVQKEYDRIGKNNLDWYNLNYWIKYFSLDTDDKILLQKYENTIKIYQDAPLILEKLSSDYTLICISSMPFEFITPKIKKIKKYFSSIHSALSEYKCLKNRYTYLKICQKINIEPKKIFHIGDSEYSDFLEAREAGLHSILIDRKKSNNLKKYGRDVITSLIDIPLRIKEYI